MKKIIFAFIIAAFFFQAGIVQADKSDAVFAIQKARSAIEKVKIRGEELKAPTDELEKAKKQLDQADAVLKKNTSLLGMGGLKKEAEPEIRYYVEMAEINTAIVSSRLEKIGQEKENARLEKLVPDLESKIKVFADKNAEIKKLKQELSQPRTKSAEAAQLKKENTELAAQLAKLKAERENLSGKLGNLNRNVEYVRALAKFNYLSKISDKGYTLIVPRKDLFKTTSKGSVLAPGAEQFAAKLVEFIKAYPSKIELDVHGAGSPAKTEDRKATEKMADVLKKALVQSGVSESAIRANGFGSSEPIFSKTAVEDNRRVEITFYE